MNIIYILKISDLINLAISMAKYLTLMIFLKYIPLVKTLFRLYIKINKISIKKSIERTTTLIIRNLNFAFTCIFRHCYQYIKKKIIYFSSKNKI